MRVKIYPLTRRVFLSAVISLTPLSTIYAGQICTPWESKNNHKAGLIIGTININTFDIFDLNNPKESRKIHRISNKIHKKTLPSTIRNQLLMKEGDPFQFRQLKEMQRLLKANNYVKDASVVPLELCNNRVTIDIKTTDKWTLTPGISFGRQGGKNKSGVEIQEHNLFGLGKSLSINFKNGLERKETRLEYVDPQLLGSKKRLAVSVNDNSDGKGHKLNLSLPFY